MGRSKGGRRPQLLPFFLSLSSLTLSHSCIRAALENLESVVREVGERGFGRLKARIPARNLRRGFGKLKPPIRKLGNVIRETGTRRFGWDEHGLGNKKRIQISRIRETEHLLSEAADSKEVAVAHLVLALGFLFGERPGSEGGTVCLPHLPGENGIEDVLGMCSG